MEKGWVFDDSSLKEFAFSHNTVVPEILSRVLHKDSQGGDAKILGLWVGNQSCKKDSHPPQPLQKKTRCCRMFSCPPFLLKKHSHLSHNHPFTMLFKMTCAKQIPTCCKTILIQALLSDWLLIPFCVSLSKVQLALPSKWGKKERGMQAQWKVMFGVRELLGFMPPVLCLSSVTMFLKCLLHWTHGHTPHWKRD